MSTLKVPKPTSYAISEARLPATLSAGSLASGDSVALVGFGTFNVRHRAARMGRNPQTGESIQISASKSVGFKVGKALKESLKFRFNRRARHLGALFLVTIKWQEFKT